MEIKMAYMQEIQEQPSNNGKVIGSSEIKVSMPLGCDTDIFKYRRIQFNGISLSTDVCNNCCILHDTSICTACSIEKHGNTFRVGVRRYTEVADIYNIGIKSSAVSLHKCSILSAVFYIHPNDIRRKCYRMPFPRENLDDNEEGEQEAIEYAVAEMLHSDACKIDYN